MYDGGTSPGVIEDVLVVDLPAHSGAVGNGGAASHGVGADAGVVASPGRGAAAESSHSSSPTLSGLRHRLGASRRAGGPCTLRSAEWEPQLDRDVFCLRSLGRSWCQAETVEWYTRRRVMLVLSLMGCKASHAHRILENTFTALAQAKLRLCGVDECTSDAQVDVQLTFGPVALRVCSTAVVSSACLERLVRAALIAETYDQPAHVVLFRMSRQIIDRRKCIVVLVSGTSGTGKSTIASVLASRLGITTVISTDSVRHQLRQELSRQDHPHLFVSTYQAGATIEDAVADDVEGKVLAGYKRQCALVTERLEQLLDVFSLNSESVIVEGVHLNMDFVARMMDKFEFVVPFLVYISNPTKHEERFAVRSKYMTLHPGVNSYVRHMEDIRIIQGHLVERAGQCLFPKIDNTNVDRSIAAMHSVILRCMRHVAVGRKLFDSTKKQAVIINQAFRDAHDYAWSSKAMQAVIRQKAEKKVLFDRLFRDMGGGGGERHLVNSNGSTGIADFYPELREVGAFVVGGGGDEPAAAVAGALVLGGSAAARAEPQTGCDSTAALRLAGSEHLRGGSRGTQVVSDVSDHELDMLRLRFADPASSSKRAAATARRGGHGRGNKPKHRSRFSSDEGNDGPSMLSRPDARGTTKTPHGPGSLFVNSDALDERGRVSSDFLSMPHLDMDPDRASTIASLRVVSSTAPSDLDSMDLSGAGTDDNMEASPASTGARHENLNDDEQN